MTNKSLSKKTVKKETSSLSLSQYSLKERKEAKDIAVADLLISLKKLKNGETIRFGNLGTFEKSQHKIKSNFPGKSYGKTLLYYRINFRASSILKRELDK